MRDSFVSNFPVLFGAKLLRFLMSEMAHMRALIYYVYDKIAQHIYELFGIVIGMVPPFMPCVRTRTIFTKMKWSEDS